MMTVAQLIRELQEIPGHLPVHVAVRADGSGGGADTDYYFVAGAELDSFPTHGNMAVIQINYHPS